MLPSLSIVIPSHNRPDLLHACLRTVTQHAPLGTEILVVDDASPNGAARSVADAFAGVRYIRLWHCGGFCVAANAGIRATSGTVVHLLNDDTQVTAGWASAALACFEDQSVGAVAPLVLRAPGRPVIDSAGDRYYLGGIAGKRGRGEEAGPSYLRRCRVFGASASSAFYRRELLLRVGALPESFGAYFEDVDLSFRLHRAGYQIVFEPAARVFHRVAASYGQRRRRLLEQQSCNEERVFWRNLPRFSLVRALPRHLAVLAAKVIQRWHEGALAPFLCGRLRVLTEVVALKHHRRWLDQLGPAADIEQWGVESRFWGSK